MLHECNLADELFEMNNLDHQQKAFEYWKANPVQMVKDWFGATPTDYQGDILMDALVRGKNRTAVKSSHGVGKTTIDAWLGLIFLNTRPMSRVVATAPTKAQLNDILWPEYAKWLAKCPQEIRGMWELSGGHIRHKEHPNLWFAVSRTSNRPENLQGFHCDHLMVQVDEASGVPQNVFEVIEGALSDAEEEGGESLLILTGNPNFTAGEMYNAFNKNAELYNRFTISGDKTTIAEESDGKFYVSKRVTAAYRKNMAKKYGDDSAVYSVRVRGKFPMTDDHAVIPLEWAQRAVFVERPNFDKFVDPWHMVMDVARFGGDETTLGLYRAGHMLSLKAWPKTSTVQCVDILTEAKKSIEAKGGVVGRITVDEPGVGGGVVDFARRENLNITPYNGGGSLKEGTDPAEDIRMFANKRSRDWWHLRRIMEVDGVSIVDDEDETLVNQLASVQFDYNPKEKIQIESKKDMRKRLGDGASPDRGDNLVMGLAPWYSLPEGAIPNLSEGDLDDVGDDRPQMDMDLA